MAKTAPNSPLVQDLVENLRRHRVYRLNIDELHYDRVGETNLPFVPKCPVCHQGFFSIQVHSFDDQEDLHYVDVEYMCLTRLRLKVKGNSVFFARLSTDALEEFLEELASGLYTEGNFVWKN